MSRACCLRCRYSRSRRRAQAQGNSVPPRGSGALETPRDLTGTPSAICLGPGKQSLIWSHGVSHNPHTSPRRLPPPPPRTINPTTSIAMHQRVPLLSLLNPPDLIELEDLLLSPPCPLLHPDPPPPFPSPHPPVPPSYPFSPSSSIHPSLPPSPPLLPPPPPLLPSSPSPLNPPMRGAAPLGSLGHFRRRPRQARGRGRRLGTPPPPPPPNRHDDCGGWLYHDRRGRSALLPLEDRPPLGDLARGVARGKGRGRKRELSGSEREFLPAAIEIMEQPASPMRPRADLEPLRLFHHRRRLVGRRPHRHRGRAPRARWCRSAAPRWCSRSRSASCAKSSSRMATGWRRVSR